MLEVTNDVIDIASSDDEDDVGNSVSENVDSTSENLDNRNVEICSSDEEVSENYITRLVLLTVYFMSSCLVFTLSAYRENFRSRSKIFIFNYLRDYVDIISVFSHHSK